MPTIVKPLLAAGLLLASSACSKLEGGGQDQMTWAKDALERNDRIEVVASDPAAKTFTVRVKESGQLVVLPIDRVIAGPTGAVLTQEVFSSEQSGFARRWPCPA